MTITAVPAPRSADHLTMPVHALDHLVTHVVALHHRCNDIAPRLLWIVGDHQGLLALVVLGIPGFRTIQVLLVLLNLKVNAVPGMDPVVPDPDLDLCQDRVSQAILPYVPRNQRLGMLTTSNPRRQEMGWI